MPRYIRNTAILAKTETVYGTDPVPTGAANALLVSEVSINPFNAQNVDRDLVRTFFGGSEQLVGTAYVEASFTVELAASGTAGTAPAWAPLLIACGYVESGAAGYKQYAPDVPSAQKSVTIYYYDDGVLHKLLGAKGTFQLMSKIGERPVLKFNFTGLDGGVTAAANPTQTLTAWKTPAVITNPNTQTVKFGATYAAAVLTGGTGRTSKGLDLTLGNTVAYSPLLGSDGVDITQRAVTGSIELDLDAAAEVATMVQVKANTIQSVALEHLATAGQIVGIYMAGVQLINPKKTDFNGRRLIGFDMRSVPVSGNDDLIIYTK
jgi:hypothetical protein